MLDISITDGRGRYTARLRNNLLAIEKGRRKIGRCAGDRASKVVGGWKVWDVGCNHVESEGKRTYLCLSFCIFKKWEHVIIGHEFY